MTDYILQWVRKENRIKERDRVIAGVSGGADSVCLLYILLGLKKEINFSLQAVHIEHGMRGEEGEEDARFVQELCEKLGILCHTYHVNVPRYAAEHGLGDEEAARELRYACYRREAELAAAESAGGSCGSALIALAHHADDNAETVLFQMIRGSGIDGLCGMRASREFLERAEIIRPLLGVTRAQIEGYLQGIGQDYRVDSTNQDVCYSRNRIRREVMPQLTQINSQAVAHINQMAFWMQEISDYIRNQVKEIVDIVYSKQREGHAISVQLFRSYPPLLQREVVHWVLESIAGRGRDIGRVHVEAVIALADRQVGKRIQLPYRICAERTYKGICVFREMDKSEEELLVFELTDKQLLLAEKGETIAIALPEGLMQFRIFDFHGEIGEIPKKKYTKWLNYDRIKSGLKIRRRMGGDYLTIDQEGHRKKLKAWFIEEKIPKRERDITWLLAEQSHILWVAGGRISARYRIEKDTKRILEVQFTGGNAYED